jgi:hypothetical protein
MTPWTLKASVEAADRAAARGAPGEALRLLLAAAPGPIAPDHDHTCPECGEGLRLDEPCGDPAAPSVCGDCEGAGAVGDRDDVTSRSDVIDAAGEQLARPLE